MNAKLSDTGLRGILLDIEGTTTPIDFVHDVLFSYSRTHMRQFLTNNPNTREVRADIALLHKEHACDVSEGRHPPSFGDDIESIAAYIDWLITLDQTTGRKSTGVKSLQGKIWRQGYSEGVLKSPVFPDVAPALERWHAAGLSISIFSSGSILAQQLLFAYTEAGDLTRFIDNYFDTGVGKKIEADSYRRIATALDLEAREIVFISDVVGELEAAREAGLRTLLCLRPGNPPPASTATTFDRITEFSGLT